MEYPKWEGIVMQERGLGIFFGGGGGGEGGGFGESYLPFIGFNPRPPSWQDGLNNTTPFLWWSVQRPCIFVYVCRDLR